MPSIRQDAWSHAEDCKLAETILRHISGGSTQLAGFAEAAVLLSRTSAACGFRWNSAVRKQYSKELTEAKAQRKGLKKGRQKDLQSVSSEEIATDPDHRLISDSVLDQMILFLNRLKDEQPGQFSQNPTGQLLQQVQAENSELTQSCRKLELENKTLRKNYADLLGVIKMIDQARRNISTETDGLSVTSE
ncbi:hypothetical protein [Sporolactobacillus pectinivorans]|uniref:hypothetical protein n=1 Tax=Sporolactobacillus pectinivorans TaxID=1591408 RepID=UPI000C264A79|nr:hypothetical protein [Sporolactobacillus pectinivorans]